MIHSSSIFRLRDAVLTWWTCREAGQQKKKEVSFPCLRFVAWRLIVLGKLTSRNQLTLCKAATDGPGRMTPPRAVLDTNVPASARLFHCGALSWLRGVWHAGRMRPLAGRQTTADLVRVLACPGFTLRNGARPDVPDDHLPCRETVAVPELLPAVPECRDPFDRVLLELALATTC